MQVLLDGACHGWLPFFVPPLLVFAAGVWLVEATGPCSLGDRWRFVRFVPIAAGVFARQTWGIDGAAAAGLLVALAMTRETDRAQRPLRRAAAVAVVGVAVMHSLLATGAGHHIEETLANGLAAVASLLCGHTIDTDAVYGGSRAFTLLLVASLAVAGSVAHLAKIAGVLAITGIAACATVGIVAGAMPSFGSSPDNAHLQSILAAQLPWIPAALFSLAGGAALCWRSEGTAGLRTPAPAVCALTALLVACGWPGQTAASRPGVLFHEPGFSNWMTPDPNFADTGEYSAGMLGTLPAFVKSLGMPAALRKDLDAGELGAHGTLVFINQMAPLGETKVAAIERWVREGGRLLVIGDHTAYHHDEASGRTEIFLNEPLHFTSIRFPNNSSDHLTMAYREGVVETGLGHTIGCAPGNPFGCVIGAGLSLQWPAIPVVVGRHGYLDAGKFDAKEHRDFIGDLTWNQGERLGGVVNVAWQAIGKGSVLVVGDTTGVTNIGRCFGWQTWAQWFAGELFPSRVLHALHAMGLLGLAWLLFVSRRLPLAAMLTASGVFAALALAAAGAAPDLPVMRQQPGAPVTVIELATRPPGRLGGWGNDGLLSVAVTAMRIGGLPVYADTTAHDVLSGASTLVISCPQADPGEAWAQDVAAWTRAGGNTIVACSHAESLHVQHLLEQFGAAVDASLVGAIRAELGKHDGVDHAVQLRESWRLRFLQDGWRRVVYRDDHVMMATRSFGAGRVTLISDSTFLRNGALEGKWGANLQNLQFVKLLLAGKEWS